MIEPGMVKRLGHIVPDGGMIDLVYTVDIENSAAGTVDYHLDIAAK